ncbi:MAG: toxic anion resistance protein [Syntrophobacteraceae bacterium]
MDVATLTGGEIASLNERSQQFSPEEMQKIQGIVQGINVKDSQAVILYGVETQKKIALFADNVLNQVRAKDAGYVGEILTELMFKVKDVNVEGLTGSKRGLSAIPIIGKFFDEARRFLARYEKLSTQVDAVIDKLDKARMGLLKDVSVLDRLYQINAEYFRDLTLLIAAGEMKLKEIQEKAIPDMRTKAEASNDPFDAQQISDLMQLANRFEKKLHDLKLSKAVSIQTAPQIRLVQSNDEALIEKVQSSILNTMPLWKNQIVIALSIARGKQAAELQRQVSDMTNQLLEKNMEMLKQSSVDIAKESERGIVDIETLKKTNSALISTIEETIQIQQEGRRKRLEAETELVRMEKELQGALANIAA